MEKRKEIKGEKAHTTQLMYTRKCSVTDLAQKQENSAYTPVTDLRLRLHMMMRHVREYIYIYIYIQRYIYVTYSLQYTQWAHSV